MDHRADGRPSCLFGLHAPRHRKGLRHRVRRILLLRRLLRPDPGPWLALQRPGHPRRDLRLRACPPPRLRLRRAQPARGLQGCLCRVGADGMRERHGRRGARGRGLRCPHRRRRRRVPATLGLRMGDGARARLGPPQGLVPGDGHGARVRLCERRGVRRGNAQRARERGSESGRRRWIHQELEPGRVEGRQASQGGPASEFQAAEASERVREMRPGRRSERAMGGAHVDSAGAPGSRDAA
mmetsp:Transcript_92080/g.137867  ORF Transcript_92080/g.137867 Transcript_92080/m.137867 type:complete len:240 (-) Transcript_92080:64-783(-)